jgi:hypothetical protein
MEKTKNTSPNKNEVAAVPNHMEKIKSQVLAKIGKPSRLDRLEISRHHNGKYRVNIWQQPEPTGGCELFVSFIANPAPSCTHPAICACRLLGRLARQSGRGVFLSPILDH